LVAHGKISNVKSAVVLPNPVFTKFIIGLNVVSAVVATKGLLGEEKIFEATMDLIV
jgi:hypothetical protein